MILDEGCAERGCPMHDERETKGVEFIRKEWVGLTDAELMECTVFKRFECDPPYIDKDGAKHVGSIEVSLRRTYENINNKLKEKNT
jgi:hypothetical protein